MYQAGFVVMVTTEDSCFVFDGSLVLAMVRETSPEVVCWTYRIFRSYC